MFDEVTLKRFWSKVNKNGPVHPVHGPCWQWTAGTDKDGYGVLGSPIINGAKHYNKRAHRISAAIHKIKDFEILDPESLIMHCCDNVKCVNPTHLQKGTTIENVKDRCDKGRTNTPLGQDHGYSKLTDDQVRQIRQKYIPRLYTQEMIAKEYGVCRALISLIVNNKNWKHIK